MAVPDNFGAARVALDKIRSEPLLATPAFRQQLTTLFEHFTAEQRRQLFVRIQAYANALHHDHKGPVLEMITELRQLYPNLPGQPPT